MLLCEFPYILKWYHQCNYSPSQWYCVRSTVDCFMRIASGPCETTWRREADIHWTMSLPRNIPLATKLYYSPPTSCAIYPSKGMEFHWQANDQISGRRTLHTPNQLTLYMSLPSYPTKREAPEAPGAPSWPTLGRYTWPKILIPSALPRK